MELDEKWLRDHLPADCRQENLNVFSGLYLQGLCVMAEGERGNPDTVVYMAKNREDLRYWQLGEICRFVGKADHSKTWRWYRDHAENGQWYYIEHRHYDYNAIEDFRLAGFERCLINMKYGFPPERWEKQVQRYTRLMNRWFPTDHWGYDRENLRFIEISDVREYHSDSDRSEEPKPGTVIRIVE